MATQEQNKRSSATQDEIEIVDGLNNKDMSNILLEMAQEIIQDKTPPKDAFTVYDFMKVAKISETSARRHLRKKVDNGVLQSKVFKSGGKGNPMYYWKADKS